ncbi:hypothetical protein BS50DRAFT_580643 [Corynespora cassiicola Philippines]|uniref:Transcription factor domain-containing protein n=1 Tax=Corynespora cassiicola Philippines TaxID=1448308 RepID=A0A2T2MZD7_CORCC|nr:hypothetical protein BS50DRAFT_580643 [Corynespora cassiicola Philippines]
MVFEQDRGLIRVWGIGEGQDANDGAQAPSSPESNDSNASSPAPVREGIWGYPPADHSSPSTLGGHVIPHSRETVGGLGHDGRPNFQSATLWRLYSSYMQHIHSLHPFLNPSKLHKRISAFSTIYSPDFKGKTVASPGSAVPGGLNAGVKRKRSSRASGDHYTPAQDPSVNGIERSLRNAIVLLVLALGKVCEYEEPLPAPQSERDLTSDGSWGFTRSFSKEIEAPRRNIDIIPGMAYYSYATDILGNQQGGNTVAHAQAMLLAALVLESWSWIHNACRIGLVLIKEDIDKIERKIYFDAAHPVPQFTEKENYRLNLVKCVYWTCLQLETDILAEMSTLPPTEISKYQDRISYPSGIFEKFPTSPDAMTCNENSEQDKMMWIYSSHIHLRVILNEAHNTLYGATGRKRSPNFDTTNVKEVENTARSHVDALLSWRRLLPQELSWDDGDPPPTDIYIARLRAKYYGGHYMILRPLLHIAVHDIPLPPGPPTDWSQNSSPAATVESAGTPRHNSMSRGLIDLTSGQDKVLDVAHQCITSAIRSTIAFDRVGANPNEVYTRFENKRPKRLILTNIFGTIHAQFGNMIVLAAVWKSRLRQFLPEDTMLTKGNLIDLFDRTTKVLAEVVPNSPILKMDLDILHNVRKQLSL